MEDLQQASAAWDAEYQAGRYATEAPIPFVQDIIAAARTHSLGHGLYVGCGNGRNYVPLAQTGLTLTGLDISRHALQQLAERAPEHRDRLIHGDLTVAPPEQTFDLLIGIQVFQHGNRATAHTACAKPSRNSSPAACFACASTQSAPTCGPNTN